jgi:endoglycosylceramidase
LRCLQVDAHQDLFSPRFCADGAPSWVGDLLAANASGFPEPLAPPYTVDNSTGMPAGDDCGQFAWSTYYFTYAVGSAFQALYTTPAGIALAQSFWQAVAAAYARSPAALAGVLGWELINEPWPGEEEGRACERGGRGAAGGTRMVGCA